jgi:RNA polymerase sigma factor (sigma-70 family)
VTGWTYNVILAYVHNNEDAEEVIQDTLMATINGIGNFKSESSIKTWVYRIAINKSKDVVKYKNRKKRFATVISISKNSGTDDRDIEPLSFSHPGIELESKEQMDLLLKGIDQLPEKQKEALILAKFEQMSMKDIAVLMKTTDKAVESLLSRAKSNFKTYLLNEGINRIK